MEDLKGIMKKMGCARTNGKEELKSLIQDLHLHPTTKSRNLVGEGREQHQLVGGEDDTPEQEGPPFIHTTILLAFSASSIKNRWTHYQYFPESSYQYRPWLEFPTFSVKKIHILHYRVEQPLDFYHVALDNSILILGREFLAIVLLGHKSQGRANELGKVYERTYFHV